MRNVERGVGGRVRPGLMVALMLLVACGDDPTAPEILGEGLEFEARRLVLQRAESDDVFMPRFRVSIDDDVPSTIRDDLLRLRVQGPHGLTAIPVDFTPVENRFEVTAVGSPSPNPVPAGTYTLTARFSNGDELTVDADLAPDLLDPLELLDLTLVSDGTLTTVSARWLSPPQPHDWEISLLEVTGGQEDVLAGGVSGASSGSTEFSAGVGAELEEGRTYALRITLDNDATIRIADFEFTIDGT